MLRALVYRCSLLLAMLTPLAGSNAQKPPQPDAPLTSGLPSDGKMLATDKFLFVVHEGVLHQFDLKTLKLRNRTRLVGAKELAQLDLLAKGGKKPNKAGTPSAPPKPPH